MDQSTPSTPENETPENVTAENTAAAHGAPESAATEPTAVVAPVAQAAPAVTPAPARPVVRVDESKATTGYANFCRVSATPEELVLDFGLNAQPMGPPTDPIQVHQRVVVNFYTAKRLAQALIVALQRHEAAFGVLETDVQRRFAARRNQAGGQ